MSLTDEPTAAAITAVWHDDETTAERWFSLISTTYHGAMTANDGNPPDFDQFWSAFDSAASSDHGANVEAFHGYLANVNDPMAVIADLAGDTPDAVLAEVVGRYREGVAGAYAQQEEEAPAEDDGEPYDESYWTAYLQRWAGAWDGTDDAWTEFAEGFSYWAAQEPKFAAQIKEQADTVLAHAAALALAERVAYLTGFDLVGGVVAAVESAVEVEVAEAENAELISEIASTQTVTDAVEALIENDMVPILTEALNEVPAAAALTPEEINEVLEEVLAEQLTQTIQA